MTSSPAVPAADPGNFSSDLDRAHGPNWRSWLGHLADQPASGLELGTWKGQSAEWMLQHIFTHPAARYTCVDTFEGSDEHRLAGIDCSTLYDQASVRLAPYWGRVQIFKARSDQLLRGAMQDRNFDFIYVDAAHDAMNVLRDSVLAFDLLKVGGVMVWDDYAWTAMADDLDRPKIAIDAFLGCYARRAEILGMGWQVAVKRVA